MSETKPNVFPQSGENKPSGEPEQPVTGVYQIPDEQKAAAEELRGELMKRLLLEMPLLKRVRLLSNQNQ